jgi:hypothetical protein
VFLTDNTGLKNEYEFTFSLKSTEQKESLAKFAEQFLKEEEVQEKEEEVQNFVFSNSEICSAYIESISA